MNSRHYLHDALINLSSSALRSTLALLGILIGTASVVAMISGGKLATNEALKQFKTLGTDLISVVLNETVETDSLEVSQTLSLSQAEQLIHADKNILAIAPYTQLYDPIQYVGHELNATVLGITEYFKTVINIHLVHGRFISLYDHYQQYCIIGKNVAQEISALRLVNPIGQQIQVGKHYFTIVGVADAWPENNFVYASIDNSIMIPLLAGNLLNKNITINNIIMRLKPNADIEQVKAHIEKNITETIKNKHLFFRSAKELLARMAKQSEILTIFLGLTGGISLIVGGIGIMNIMLVSVIERKKEIGVRMALGAKQKDILLLFLMEALLLSLVGGSMGILLGLLISFIIAFTWHWQFVLFVMPPVIGFFVSVSTGIFFGFYPALKASQLNPIDALRAD